MTQTYDAGACVYFYFGFRWNADCTDPVHVYEEIENNARDEILASGELFLRLKFFQILTISYYHKVAQYLIIMVLEKFALNGTNKASQQSA